MVLSTMMLWMTAAHAEPMWLAGQEVDPALYIDLTKEGLDQVEGILSAVLPPTVPIDNSGLVSGGSIGGGFLGADYEFGVQNLVVLPAISNADVLPMAGDPTGCRQTLPSNGRLRLNLDLDVSLNTPSDPAYAFISADLNLFGLGLNVLDEDCNINMAHKHVTATVDITVGPQLDPFTCQPNVDANGYVKPEVKIDSFSWDMDIDSIDDLSLDCSGFLSLLLDLADFFGIDPVELLLDSLRPTIDGTITDAIDSIVPQINDALGALVINQSLPLLGANYDVQMGPRDVKVTNDGLRITMSGALDPGEFPASCVSEFDPGGSRLTIPPNNPRYPQLRDQSVDFEQHVALQVNDDFINQALYGLWRNGLLCQSITSDSSPVDLPIPLDSSLLGLLAGGKFDEFFPTPQPLLIQTRPVTPPTFAMTNSTPAAVLELDDLGIDFYAELDGRYARFVGLDMTAQAGVDVVFDGLSGNLGAAVTFDPSKVTTKVTFNDLKPDASAQVESGWGAIVETVAGPLINSLLGENLTFALPSFKVTPDQPSPLGIQTAVLAASGPIKDFMGVFGDFGLVSYGGSAATGGCDLFGGSGGAGCGGGCSSPGVPTRIGWLLLPMLVAGLRRRR